MNRMRHLFCIIIGLVFVNGDYNVTLEEVSSVFLPSAPQRIWDLHVADEASYDADNKLLYVVGGLYRSIIDMKNPRNLAPLRVEMSPQGNLEYTGISVCGNYFIQTTTNKANMPRGTVEIFRKFEASTSTESLFSAEVGGDPTAVRFLPGCTTAVVVVRGSAYGRGSNFVDPIGKVIIVRLPVRPSSGGFADNVHMTTLNFTDFDSRVSDLLNKGARFVFRDRNNSFSNDVDPLKLAVSKDGRTVYIGLQRTNAIAVIDVSTNSITDVYGLGMKSWQNLKMDASDKDGGINMRKWPIYSYYLPDGLDFMSHGGQNYIVTANEGDDYDYSDLISWKEEMTGREFVEKNLTASNLSDDMESWLANDTMLGRLRFTTENGQNNANGYSRFVMLGSRSFSIWDAKTLGLVYDSGDDIATRHANMYPDLFNCAVNGTDTPQNDADTESQKRGPEPESVAVGTIGRLSLIFVGNESPGTINVYSVLDDVTKPKFEFLWQGVQNTSQTWESQFSSKTIKGIGPERIIFLPETQSPTGKPAIIVIASGSGSVTLFNVKLTGTVPPPSAATEFRLSGLLLAVVILIQVLSNQQS